MPFFYYDWLSIANISSIFSFILVFYGLALLIMLTMSIAVYALQAYGLYRLAKRRAIKKAWLAWLPLGNNGFLAAFPTNTNMLPKARSAISEAVFWH